MCDTIAVVTDEGVFFAKNSDRDANEPQRLEWHGAGQHAPGALVQCTWIPIPQVRETLPIVIGRPFWMWGAEVGTNVCGVTIGNEAVFTNQPYAATGLTGMDMVRLALERADTAERAVATIIELLETWGQGGGCGHEDRGFTYHNSFLVADPCSAWVLETAGRHWATEQVTGARTISNVLTIPHLRERYRDRLVSAVCRADPRRARTLALVSGSVDLPAMLAATRDHGTDQQVPSYSPVSGAMGAPCMHAGGLVASSQTTNSWVSWLSPDGVSHWATGTSAPCTGIYKPIVVDQPVDVGAPTDRADDTSLWWRHERLHRRVARNPAALLPLYAGERDALERRWLQAPPDSRTAFETAARLTSAWTRTVAAASVPDVRPVWARRFWARRNRRAGISGTLL